MMHPCYNLVHVCFCLLLDFNRAASKLYFNYCKVLLVVLINDI